MDLMDQSFGQPAWELACDEALLESCEAGAAVTDGILRFWKPASHFVVLGYANKAAQEVAANVIPVFRRCTGGGSVLQGPGCLNYSLVLPIAAAPELASITQTNCFIMQRHRDALVPLLATSPRVEGYTDLTLNGRKFSGNSQRRKNRWLLFHGTFLLQCDIQLMEQVLRPPPRQPEYRQHRTHAEFLTALELPARTVKEALARAWNAETPFQRVPEARIKALVEEKYSRREWNFRA
jgi:lipoate---protein ligase